MFRVCKSCVLIALLLEGSYPQQTCPRISKEDLYLVMLLARTIFQLPSRSCIILFLVPAGFLEIFFAEY